MKLKPLLSLLLILSPFIALADQCRTDTIYNYYFHKGSTVKRLIGRTIYQYNDSNLVDNFISEKRDTINHVFVKSIKMSYTYNQKGQILYQMYYGWNSTQ